MDLNKNINEEVEPLEIFIERDVLGLEKQKIAKATESRPYKFFVRVVIGFLLISMSYLIFTAL